jgi:hypothetical protein
MNVTFHFIWPSCQVLEACELFQGLLTSIRLHGRRGRVKEVMHGSLDMFLCCEVFCCHFTLMWVVSVKYWQMINNISLSMQYIQYQPFSLLACLSTVHCYWKNVYYMSYELINDGKLPSQMKLSIINFGYQLLNIRVR